VYNLSKSAILTRFKTVVPNTEIKQQMRQTTIKLNDRELYLLDQALRYFSERRFTDSETLNPETNASDQAQAYLDSSEADDLIEKLDEAVPDGLQKERGAR
jgi:hypothetical protein